MSFRADRERGSAGSAGAAPRLALAIPGVTVSWSQAPYLFVATAASLAIHEVLTVCHRRKQGRAIALLVLPDNDASPVKCLSTRFL